MSGIAQGRHADGRYAEKTPCDACGKPVTGDHYTGDEVCAGGDGPGFYLCGRKRCVAKRPESVSERAAYYAAQRAANKHG